MSIRSIALMMIFLATLVAGEPLHSAKPRDINKVKKEQQTLKQQLKETTKAIPENNRETERNLNRLSRLDADMADSRARISRISGSIDSINSAIKLRTDSIAELEGRIADMKAAYAKALRAAQPYREQNTLLSFIFSSESVRQAYQRFRYLKQFSSWRTQRTDELKGAMDELEKRRSALESIEQKRRNELSAMNQEQAKLAKQQEQTSALVAKLKTERTSLNRTLKQREERARALDRELDRLIAEEQARIERERKAEAERQRKELAKQKEKQKEKTGTEKDKASKGKETASGAKGKSSAKPELSAEAAADRKLTGSFAANKGRLLFPVAGKYRVVRTFGRQRHPELQHVETNNSGIDIEVNAGTTARAIFEGTVSAVFKLPGYATIVMVRHGEYISLYANLQDIYVKKGDTVKAGQNVGRIYTDPEDDGRTTFHFELRKERTKLNPLEWVK